MKPYTTFLRNFFISRAGEDFVFAYAIYTVFFSIQGMSPMQISLLLMRWAGSSAIAEIPSGALADYLGRKTLLVIGPLIKALCFLTWFLADGNFWLFGLGFLFRTIGSSLISGSEEALLYDTLKQYNKPQEYEKITGRKKFYTNIGQAIAALMGGFMAEYSLDFAIVFSIVPLIISAWFASQLREPPHKDEHGISLPYREHIVSGFREIFHHRTLWIVFVFLLGLSFAGLLDEFDPLYYEFVDLPLWAFGIVGAIRSGIMALGGWFAHRIKHYKITYYGGLIVAGLLLVCIGQWPSMWMIAVLMGMYFVMTVLQVLVEGNFQHRISSRSRATTTSIIRCAINGIGALLFPLYGIVGEYFGIPFIYWTAGVGLILLGGWIYTKRNVVAEE